MIGSYVPITGKGRLQCLFPFATVLSVVPSGNSFRPESEIMKEKGIYRRLLTLVCGAKVVGLK